ncbi:hypothetical protein CCHR01_01190 [Colletotrichum chrysophilum]|uniref:Uncharacterized protein n=1 Tax=Colletotrichum chrysophilum TaxID=1836956 RepID=A0AAD9EPE6_9PEZI|nr:hypothetical protein CCHR01_01190 [Colletotrichum chrysophilum]
MLQHAALSSHPTHATDAAAPPSGPLECMREETRSQADSTRRTWDGQRDEGYCSPAQLPLCTMESSRAQFSLKCYLTYLNQRTKKPKGPPAKHPRVWFTGFRPTITGSSSPSKSEDEGKKKVAPLSLLPPPMRAQNCSIPRPQSLHYTSDAAAWLARLTGVAGPVCGFSGSPPTLRCPANSGPKAPHSSRLSFHPVHTQPSPNTPGGHVCREHGIRRRAREGKGGRTPGRETKAASLCPSTPLKNTGPPYTLGPWAPNTGGFCLLYGYLSASFHSSGRRRRTQLRWASERSSGKARPGYQPGDRRQNHRYGVRKQTKPREQ